MFQGLLFTSFPCDNADKECFYLPTWNCLSKGVEGKVRSFMLWALCHPDPIDKWKESFFHLVLCFVPVLCLSNCLQWFFKVHSACHKEIPHDSTDLNVCVPERLNSVLKEKVLILLSWCLSFVENHISWCSKISSTLSSGDGKIKFWMVFPLFTYTERKRNILKYLLVITGVLVLMIPSSRTWGIQSR